MLTGKAKFERICQSRAKFIKIMTNIYIITNLINNKKYVGKTIKTLQERLSNHFRTNNNKNMYIHQAMMKYGKENFKIELIAQVPDEE